MDFHCIHQAGLAGMLWHISPFTQWTNAVLFSICTPPRNSSVWCILHEIIKKTVLLIRFNSDHFSAIGSTVSTCFIPIQTVSISFFPRSQKYFTVDWRARNEWVWITELCFIRLGAENAFNNVFSFCKLSLANL